MEMYTYEISHTCIGMRFPQAAEFVFFLFNKISEENFNVYFNIYFFVCFVFKRVINYFLRNFLVKTYP